MHGCTKCMVVQNAWWYEMHGGTKCIVVRNAWWYEMHGVRNAWWYEMHGGTKCMVCGICTKKQKTTLNAVWNRLNHARTRRG
jgi:hypothetical protein